MHRINLGEDWKGVGTGASFCTLLYSFSFRDMPYYVYPRAQISQQLAKLYYTTIYPIFLPVPTCKAIAGYAEWQLAVVSTTGLI